MDLTIREYIAIADKHKNTLYHCSLIIPIDELDKQRHELQTLIKIAQGAMKHLADVSNLINQVAAKRKSSSNNFNVKYPYIDPYPTENSHVVLRTLYDKSKKHILPDIPITIRTVNLASEIPVNNLYYINSLKQYAININGIIIKGNLGNIQQYQSSNTMRCKYGIACKSFDKKTACKYYHPPEDYIALSLSVPDETRNFTPGSWVTARKSKLWARHLGSKKTLKSDLSILDNQMYKEEIFTREGQLIHDLLIYIILNEKGLINKYAHNGFRI